MLSSLRGLWQDFLEKSETSEERGEKVGGRGKWKGKGAVPVNCNGIFPEMTKVNVVAIDTSYKGILTKPYREVKYFKGFQIVT